MRGDLLVHRRCDTPLYVVLDPTFGRGSVLSHTAFETLEGRWPARNELITCPTCGPIMEGTIIRSLELRPPLPTLYSRIKRRQFVPPPLQTSVKPTRALLMRLPR